MSLVTTTLAQPVAPADTQIPLTSSASILKGDLIVIDREAMRVRVAPSSNTVLVSRGQQGTQATSHVNGATAYAGSATLFYTTDPQGVPPVSPPAMPWINLTTGSIWFAVGDQVGPNAGERAWVLQTRTPGAGALGARTVPLLTVTPTAAS